jgi:hypothetical protein
LRRRGNLDDRRLAEPEQAEAPVDRGMALRARDDAHARRAEEPVAADIPPVTVEDVPTRCRETGRVRTLGTGYESDRGSAWEAEEFLQPAAGDVLEGDRRRG